jgi:hypothetical protein
MRQQRTGTHLRRSFSGGYPLDAPALITSSLGVSHARCFCAGLSHRTPTSPTLMSCSTDSFYP